MASSVQKSLKIVNVVAVVRLSTPLNLEALLGTLPDARYDPETFPGLFWKNPPISYLLFWSGNVRITGAKSTEQVQKAISHLLRILTMAGYHAPSNPNWEIVNVVGTAYLGASLLLEKVHSELKEAEYEPEQFPSVIIRKLGGKVTALVFSSGKCVFTGGRTRDEIKSALNDLCDSLRFAGLT